MVENEEPERQRDVDREIPKISLGVWLACVASAIVMTLTSQFEYQMAMRVGLGLNLLIIMGCYLLWRRNGSSPVVRSFSIILAFLSFAGALLSLVGAGVT